ncbi:hypothetical protein S40293_11563 [Stachybotrys chartarum IBT 40293]|nr:hypothetical protein S40293_11563 [Stachybotrys chartarum IBT 40293]
MLRQSQIRRWSNSKSTVLWLNQVDPNIEVETNLLLPWTYLHSLGTTQKGWI